MRRSTERAPAPPEETWNETALRLEKMIQSATAAATHQPTELLVELAQ